MKIKQLISIAFIALSLSLTANVSFAAKGDTVRSQASSKVKKAKSTAKKARSKTKKAVRTTKKSASKKATRTTKKTRSKTKKAATAGSALGLGGLATQSRSNSNKAVSRRNTTAVCQDGTYSQSASHRGACSSHGGVKQWLK